MGEHARKPRAEAAHAAEQEKWLADVRETIAEVARDWELNGVPAKRFVTADDLRAAYAQDAPPSPRKSRRQKRPDGPGLFLEEDFLPGPPKPAADDPE